MLGWASGLIRNTDISEPPRALIWPRSAYDGFAKRACDLILAGLGLILLSPVLVAIGVLLFGLGFNKPLFLQKRVGQHGRTFVIFKFRTLRNRTCRKVPPPILRGSKRFTLMLRLSGLDELPQLINVLKGEMSLVGPRPHSLVDDHNFTARIAGYADRLAIKPGMTGWAQVQGWRGPVCSEDHLHARITCDRQYIRRQNLLFDGFILIRTLALPFKTSGHSAPWQRPCHGLEPCLHCDRRQV